MNRWQSLGVLFAGMFLIAGSAFGATVQSGSIVMDTNDLHPETSDPVPTSSMVELLVNPGFETGSLAPWTGGGWSVVTNGPHSGTFCGYDIGNNGVRQDFAPINTANVASITFWMRQPEAALSAYDLFYSDNTFDEGAWVPQVGWTLKDITSFMRPAGAMLTGIRLWGYVGGGPAPDETFLDDASINGAGATPVGPSTWGEIKTHFLN